MTDITEFPFQGLEKPRFAYTKTYSSSNGSSSDSLPNTLNTKKISNLPATLDASLKKIQSKNIELYSRKAGGLYNEYKKLHQSWGKFNNKSHSISKTNLLRLSLLSFLRLNQDDGFIDFIDDHDQELNKLQLKVCKLGTKVLSLWWNSLIEDLQTNWNKFSTIDRSAYLECISRIIARKEWNAIKQTSSLYSDNLIMTLGYCFNKLLVMKTISLSVNAFIGKVFAYSFLNLDKFGHMLLFLLFVKNYTIKKIMVNNPKQPSTDDNISFKRIRSSLNTLVNFKGDFTEFIFDEDPKHQKIQTLNCMKPPKSTYLDDLLIDLKDNNWVKKWAGFDSDIFCSFLKHYLSLSIDTLDLSVLDFNELFKLPGFVIIYGHIAEILDSNIMMIKKFKTTQSKEVNYNSNVSTSNAMKNYNIFFQKLPIIKVLKVLREVLSEGDERKSSIITKMFENILYTKAKYVQAFNSVVCEAIYNIFLEFLLHLQTNQYSFIKSLNLSFWITGLLQMLKTDNMICQARALSHLFNIWSLIPSEYLINSKIKYEFDASEWVKNPKNTLIFNLSTYLLSQPVWETFFNHWHPLIRQFYQRLLVFKVIGNSDDNYSNYLNFKKLLRSNLSTTYDIFNEKTSNLKISPIMNIDLMPSNPLLNRKLIITPMDSMQTSINILDNFDSYQFLQNGAGLSRNSSTSTLIVDSNKKIYAYDIFDEAIYSSSIGTTSTSNQTARNSLSNSSTRKNTPSSSPSVTRSSSSTTLGRVPILGSALSFLKKVNQSQPSIKVSNGTRSPSPNTSPVQTLHSPYQGPEEQFDDSRLRQGTIVLHPVQSLSSSSSRSPSFKTPTSLLSSPSSSMSEISEDDDFSFQKHRQPSSNTLNSTTSSRFSTTSSSASSVSSSTTPMESLPTPPELLIKVPDVKKFKFRFQLTFANDPTQLQYQIVNTSKISSKKFFLGSEVNHVHLPKFPRLPFDNKTNELGLMNNESFYKFEQDESFLDSSDDEADEFLVIPRNSMSSRVDKKANEPKITFSNLKNYLLLGKVLNEWDLIVDEYEKFVRLTNEMSDFNHHDLDNAGEFFSDPMLVADIPPTKVSGYNAYL